MNKSIDWSEWILQKNNEAKQEELKKSSFVTLEKAYVNQKVPQGACDCGAHKTGSEMHSDWCNGISNPNVSTQTFLNSLNDETNKKYGAQSHAGHHSISNGHESGFGADWHPDDVAIYSDFGDSNDSNHPGSQNFDQFEQHMNDQLDKIHQHMTSRGYDLIDENDGSGNGLYYGARHYRKANLLSTEDES